MAALLVVGSLLLSGLAVAGQASASASPHMIGIDMTPQAASVGEASPIDTCLSVDRGDSFDVDVFVTNVPSLTAFEFRVNFNPSVVSLDSADYDHMLTESGGSLFPIDPQEEKPGRWFLGAGNPGSMANGSGTLARLHLSALNRGSTSITISGTPTYFSPRLTGSNGVPLSDTNGDGYWDGQLTGGSVRVGASCAGSTPVVTPPPATPTRTPQPGEPTSPPGPTDSTGGGSGNGGNGGEGTPGPGATDGAEPSPFVANPSPGSEPQQTGAPVAASGGASTDKPGEDTSGLGSTAGGDGGGSDGIMLILGVLAALAVLGGGGLLLLKRYRTGV